MVGFKGSLWEARRATRDMKINLPNYLCTHFEVRANFAVSDAVGESIRSAIQQTSNHDHVATRSGLLEATVGVFGSRFSAKGIQHRAIRTNNIHPIDDDERRSGKWYKQS